MSASSDGRLDGQVHAILGKSCDPTGAFIRTCGHMATTDAERAEYVEAYNAAYRKECESMRKEGRL
jgi:hypothetical protein